jgi:hypothetical protein
LLHFQASFFKESPDDIQERLSDDLLTKPWFDQKFRQEGAKQKGAPKYLMILKIKILKTLRSPSPHPKIPIPHVLKLDLEVDS